MKLAALRARFPGFSARYLELDPRSLGLARIYLGCVLLLELARRLPELPIFFTDTGLMPGPTVLAQPGGNRLVSIFFLASSLPQAAGLFALCAVVFGLLLVGKLTRLVHLLSFLCILSLHMRTPLFEDGSESATRLLVLWTMLLPMGAGLSLDARRARMRGIPAQSGPIVTFGALAILLQLAAIYLFNSLHKSGETWREGSVVHYVLHQDRIVTWLGWVLRPHVSAGLSAVMTHGALATEAVLPVLLLSPIATVHARRAAIVLGIGLHVSFALLLNLGMFSPAMIGFFLLLISARDWELLARLAPVVWARERLRAAPRVVRLRAWWLAAGSTAATASTASTAAPIAQSRLPAWLRILPPCEVVIVLLSIVLGAQLLRDNAAVPRALRPPKPPRFVRALSAYAGLHEGWSMFAPEAPTDDLQFYVVAETVDGRLVDPLNQVASRDASTPLERIPERLGQSDAFCDYLSQIADHSEYHAALEAWVFAYPERTGRANDRIVSFSAWTIRDDSPPPGETEPTHARRELVMRDTHRSRAR